VQIGYNYGKVETMSIRWADLHKYSLVYVEFGNPKIDMDCDDVTTYTYGLNLGHEFSFRHMAVVVSNDIKASVIAVVPLTSYRDGDENYATNVVIDLMQYGHIRNIDKKKRIKKIIKPFVSKTLKIKIKEAIRRSFE